MKKEDAIKRLQYIIEKSLADGYHYEIKVNDWENYGKSRTYLSIVETRDHSKHYATKKYGYIDNMTGAYVPEKYGDMTKDYNFGGNRFQ